MKDWISVVIGTKFSEVLDVMLGWIWRSVALCK